MSTSVGLTAWDIFSSVSELPFLNECQHNTHYLCFIVMVIFNEPN